ncbi:MAG TPA: DUF1835 domain-containing protein [Caulobacteraceae bacterium]|jgi:hypothetical protein|nr:DUF1835 domain-containing protein [Caulobacteraceae bacterium]
MTALHVVFSRSAAVDLRRALTSSGKPDLVVALSDNLSFGPIDAPRPGERATWISEVLGIPGWEDADQEDARFWSGALSDLPALSGSPGAARRSSAASSNGWNATANSRSSWST